MLKTASFIALGIVIGVLATLLLRRTPDSQITQVNADTERFSKQIAVAESSAGGTSPSYEELLDENEELFDLVSEMESLLLELRDSGQRAPAEAQPRAAALRTRDQTVTELIAAGFTLERAEWIDRRAAELHRENVEAMVSLEAYARSPENLLRQELGDAEYERYLRAIGQVPAIRVGDVVGTSPAALAGLSRGDLIVTYDGRRVFDIRELIPLSLQRAKGDGVIVNILRNDESMQLVIPGGPLEAELFSDYGYAAPSFVPRQLVEQ